MAAQEDIISTAAVFRSLVRLESKQDAIMDSQKEILVDHSALKDRLTKVEGRQNWYMGAVAAVVGLVMAIPKFKDFL